LLGISQEFLRVHSSRPRKNGRSPVKLAAITPIPYGRGEACTANAEYTNGESISSNQLFSYRQQIGPLSSNILFLGRSTATLLP
ncbi:MAG TPA: hypothetical protein VFA39_16385, partial [Steroidobacteraceae bacterium]|nr:hypothetical protein [Steroidobacteraceae bacterium]